MRKDIHFSGSDSLGVRRFYEQTGRFDAREWENRKALSFTSEDAVKQELAVHLDKCPICYSTQRDFLFKKQGFDHWICLRCRSLYVDPCLRHEVIISQVYGDTEYPFLEVVNSPSQVEFDSKRFLFALSEIKKIKPSGRILDVGCGSGLFLDIARSQGYTVKGIEPLTAARNFAVAQKNLDVENAIGESFSLNKRFEIITLWELLDHVIDPNKVIQNCLKHLSHRGIVLFSVRNGHSLAARVLQEKCNMFLGYAHLNFWNQNSINLFLKNYNLRLNHMSTFISEINPINNYLNFEDPYSGGAETILEGIDAKFIIEKNLGYKFICIAQA